jgi:hypothetical protein
MRPEELTDEMKGAKVRVRLNDNFDDARATINGWSADRRVVFITVDSEYGKQFRSGTQAQVAVANVKLGQNRLR